MASEIPSRCTVCGQPTSNKCGRCKTQLYCGTECQKTDWGNHKLPCKRIELGQLDNVDKLEKALKRAATIIHEAFLNFREKTWDEPVLKIETSAEGLVIHYGPHVVGPKYFVDFQHGLVNSQQIRMAVLCTMACNQPWAWLHDIIRKALQGLPLIIEEVKLNLRGPPSKVTKVLENGERLSNWPKFTHIILRVTHSKGDKQTKWVLDITGAQLGIYNPFWKWDDYVNNFVETRLARTVWPFGTNKTCLDKLAKLEGCQSLRFEVIGDVAKSMNEAIATFEKSQGLTLNDLLLLTANDHNMRKAALLGTINGAIDAYKRTQKNKVEAKWRAAVIFDKQHPGVGVARNQKGWDEYLNQSSYTEQDRSGPAVSFVNGKIHIYV